MPQSDLARQEQNGVIATVDREQLSHAIEAALATGDLSKLSTDDRIRWYRRRCAIAKLDASTRPFEYITLQGKLTLYATKSCTDQLNGIHGISHTSIDRETVDGVHVVTVTATTKSGRTTADVGAVPIQGLKGAELANAFMKAVTKAKRRATLSLCGLGDMPDETELETIADIRPCDATGKLIPPRNESGHGRGQYASPEQTESYLKAMIGYADQRNIEWLDWAQEYFGEFPSDFKNIFVATPDKDNPAYTNRWQLDNHLVKWAIDTGRLDPSCCGESGVKNNQIGRYTAIVYHRSKSDRAAIARELERYINDQMDRARQSLQRDAEPENDDDAEDAALDAISERAGIQKEESE